ncbi:isoprenylcysteine carboxylmethyltransferase family protein [Shewanella sp. D64]|uniref:methyltransferase family protein n=1 Tax=unclassified Shewanella TaxID=196818 RepID=UPI0022BA53E1|nr:MULTISPECIES: isoprenylcysteine carboxylmethyltransferase family protein [unclassified Shewanella]MEC4726444.1 isoprenylcysteine carboxylmethyltransferase family protein [Shewanella sp. D64]MEC4738456.1 isoprenylcysteine carboxylmethyltransferase family protein [Shewanella sp. E94]WBJ94142.1 isoprenylcysteine carboxylmethyltransferase family protein [Shewanella sp. MTB7]
MEKDVNGPGVKIPPPVIFILFMLLAYLNSVFSPIELTFSAPITYLGLALLMVGVTLLLYLLYQFKTAKTAVEPWQPTSSIIKTGVYAYSRNPIYLAFCTVPVGLGLYFSDVWLISSVLPSCIGVYYVAIKPEEAYLTRKFGDEYLRYQEKVRRWI